MTKLPKSVGAIEEKFGDGLATVRINAAEVLEVQTAINCKLERLLKVSISASAINSDDLDKVELFANRLLAAVARARKLNKERGVK